MSWCTTSDLDRFAAAAGGYLRSRAAENILLLSAVQAQHSARSGRRMQLTAQQPGSAPGPLAGWWEPPDGGDPRGAFVHVPSVPLLVSRTTPEMAAGLAVTLAKMGRQVSGVDAPSETADAFAAAWSQRAGTAVRAHRSCRVYRFTGLPQGTPPSRTPPNGTPPRLTPPQGTPSYRTPANGTPPYGIGSPVAPAAPGTGAWPPPGLPGSPGRLRVAVAADRALLAGWLTAFATEAAERIDSPADAAADLISYGGAIFWEVPPARPAPLRPGTLWDTAHYPGGRKHPEDAARLAETEPAALVTLTRPVAGVVRITMLYTLPERRRNGYGVALTMAVSRALLAGTRPGAAPDGALGMLGAAAGRVNEVVLITDKNRQDRLGGPLGYQLIGERAVLRFGPVTGPLPATRPSGAMPRLPTGPLPRLPRLRS